MNQITTMMTTAAEEQDDHGICVVTVHLKVEGMMCQRNCGTTVQNCLLAIPGCIEAQAVFSEQRAVAKFQVPSSNNSSADKSYYQELAVDAIASVGFEAAVVPSPPPPVSTTVHLHVTGMMCQKNCGTTVQNALLQIPGCIEAQAFYKQQRAVAKFLSSSPSSGGGDAVVDNHDDDLFMEQAIDAVECVGFDAEPIADIDNYLAQFPDEEEAHKPSVPVPIAAAGDNEIVLQVRGMSCAVCTGRVERALQQVLLADDDHDDSSNCRVMVVLANGTAVVEFADGTSFDRQSVTAQCVDAVKAAGYECREVPSSTDGQHSSTLHDAAEQLEEAVVSEWKAWRTLLIAAVCLTIPLMMVDKRYRREKEFLSQTSSMMHWNLLRLLIVECILSSCVQFGVGKRFYIAAYHGWCDSVLGMDFLVCLGTTASYVYSVIILFLTFVRCLTPESHSTLPLDPTFTTGAMLLSFVTLGKFLESFAKGKTASALHTLMELQPLFAFRVITEDAQQIDSATASSIDLASLPVEEVSMTEIKVGDLLRVFPGSRVPTDGILVAISATTTDTNKGLNGKQEQAFIDESALSGEPFPVAKSVGDQVTGSTVNQLAVLLVRVTAVGEATALSKIVRLMERAQREKAPIQAYADRIACVFAPAVLVLSALTFTAWLAFNHHISAEERFFWAFTSAISVIVVA